MPVNLPLPDPAALFPIAGVRIGVVAAGVRKPGRNDVTVFLLDPSSSVGGVFTRNRFCAAPVQICQSHLAQSAAVRAMVVNTGNANAGTGADGLARARAICTALAQRLHIEASQVLPFSTGVILESLPSERIIAALDGAIANAATNQWSQAAQAIMTTDTVPKACGAQVQIGGKTVSITGISKGAGMIRPNMATMLGFIATDACVHPELMQSLTVALAQQSFNCITVDGDTSTNDSLVVVATHQAGHARIDSLASHEGQALFAAMRGVAQQLAHAIVRDGEGATKFITLHVNGGAGAAECSKVAYAIAHSPLVKTAFFASDPNLGRILAAVGYAGIDDLDPSRIELFLDDVHVVTRGSRNPAYQESDGQRVMRQSEIVVRVELGRGSANHTVWTCDLSHDYVTINADYRS